MLQNQGRQPATTKRGANRLRPLSRTWLLGLILAVVAIGLVWHRAVPVSAQTGTTIDADAAQSSAGSLDSQGTKREDTAENQGSLSKIVGSKSLLEVIRNGGPLMIPIGLCSFLLMAFVFERTISLRKGRVIPRPFVKRLIEQLKNNELSRDEAIALCKKNRSPVAAVFEAALQKWDRPAVEVEQAIIDSGERAANELRRYLRLINGVATVCPLLGLLGTVLGMIHAFDAIAITDAQTRPEVTIATGISQALLTTAAGLSVAIPALIAHLYFVSRVDSLVVELDALGQKLVNCIACDGYRPQPTESSGPGAKKKRSRAA